MTLPWRAQCDLLRDLVLAPHPEVVRAGDRVHLASASARQLLAFRRLLVLDVAQRRRRGAPPLEESYRETLHPLCAADHRALLARFCASPWYRRYGEVPDTSDQLALEDAFFRFLSEEDVGDPPTRKLEFLRAMIRALVVQPEPAFAIPPEIERADFGYFALVERDDTPILIASASGRFVAGSVEPLAAEWIRQRGQLGESAGATEHLRRELAAVGIRF